MSLAYLYFEYRRITRREADAAAAAGCRLEIRRLVRPTPSRGPSLAHLTWSLVILGGAGALIATELASPCPPGGPLALGNCVTLRPFALGVLGLGAALYVAGLSAVPPLG